MGHLFPLGGRRKEWGAREGVGDDVVLPGHELNFQVDAHQFLPDALDAGVGDVGEVLAEDTLQGPVVCEDGGGVGVPAEEVLALPNGIRHP